MKARIGIIDLHFHDLRHEAISRFDAQPATLQALGGWSQGSLVSDAYGDQSEPDYQAPFLEKVAFPGLDLTFLQSGPH